MPSCVPMVLLVASLGKSGKAERQASPFGMPSGKKEEKHSLSRTMWPGARQPAILTVLFGIALPARPVWTARSWLPACAQPIKAKLESFMVDDMKYCGLLNETDLTQVQQRIIASGTLTVDEMNTFFLKKN